MNLHLSTLQPKRVRHELRMRELEVINVQRISKNFCQCDVHRPGSR